VVDRICRCLREPDLQRRVGRILLLALLIAAVAYAWFAVTGARTPTRLVVYAFSTQEEVLTQTIFPAFEQAWEDETGLELSIEGVFGPSATLAGQIVLGAPADVALLSNAQHVTYLKVGRLVGPETQPAIVGYTPMVIVTRRGNPAGIAEFADLGLGNAEAGADPALTLIHANPLSSGAGQWAVLAEYGSALFASGDPAAAEAQLRAIWSNVRVLGSSARATMTLFELGAGDACVTYEQDALLAQDRGVDLEIVVPSRTIVAQHVAVIVHENVRGGERLAAQAFVDYLLSEAGQQAFERYHMRPAAFESQRFPQVLYAFTAEDLGGWQQAQAELIETLWQTQIAPRLDLELAPGLQGLGE
jgi:ABC-type sulfate transport system substrate-binding protein